MFKQHPFSFHIFNSNSFFDCYVKCFFHNIANLNTNLDLMTEQEEQLIKKFLDGDNQAYDWIYRTYAGEMLSYGKGLGFGREVLNDAIQDIFVKILYDRKLLADVRNLKCFFFRSLRNRLLNIMRSLPRQDEIEDATISFSVKVTILDQLIEDEERLALEKKVEILLNCLTDRQREAICLRFIHEMEYDDIAVLLNMTSPAARNLVSRAIDHMRKEDILLLLLFARCGINLC